MPAQPQTTTARALIPKTFRFTTWRMGSLATCLLALALSLLGPIGCGATGAGAGKAPVPAKPAPPPPPLPETVAAATPADAHQALHLDLAQLRSTPDLARAMGWLKLLPCLRGEASRTLLANAERVGMATWGDSEGDFVGFIEQGASSPHASATVLVGAVSGVLGQTPRPPAATVSDGRHRLAQTASLSAARLGGRLWLFGPTVRVRELLRRYDDPKRAGQPGYWEEQPKAYRPGGGRVLSWTSPALTPRTANALAQLGGNQVGSALAGVPVRVVVRAQPLEAQLEGELRQEQDAKTVVERVRKRLREASLILRLLGLPLDKRLKTTHNGAILNASLGLSANEAKRLLKLAEPAIPDAADQACQALAEMGQPK